ncbi:hypothetical protein E4U61_003978 [Claviceps capensis]|nr:hypothetical protein E4U61_003978 [Claviceps capensis]
MGHSALMLESQPKQRGDIIHPFIPDSPSPISERTARVHASLRGKAAESTYPLASCDSQAPGVHPQNGQVISDPGSSSKLLTPSPSPSRVISTGGINPLRQIVNREPVARKTSLPPRQKDVGPPSFAAEKEIPVNL